MDERIYTELWEEEWMRRDTEYVSNDFLLLGFREVYEVLNLRVYDLLNMNGICFYKADAMIKALYKYLNHNALVDRLMDNGELGQTFSFVKWKRKHPDSQNVTVQDIVMAKNINRKALEKLFDSIARCFYRSDEYNSREYRYYNLNDLRQKTKETNHDKK